MEKSPKAMNFSADPANWMSNLTQSIRDKIPIINLAIPGSHDSCSYGITSQSQLAPDSEEIVRIIFPLVPCVIRRWAKTQKFDIRQQLESGIRYFDLRTAYNKNDNQLYFVHGFYCDAIYEPLDELLKFLSCHPREFVILDFQHFYDLAPQHHRYLTELLNDKFSPRIFERFFHEETFPHFTLTNALHMHKQLIVIYRENRFIHRNFFYSYHWPNPWPNVTSTQKLMSALEESLQSRRPDQGWVTQMVITPTSRFILPRFYSTLRKKCAKKVETDCKEWMESQSPGCFRENETRKSNVFLLDFVDLQGCEMAKIVIDLNMKLG